MLNTHPMRRRLALGAGFASLVLAASACAGTGSSSAPAATATTAQSMAASESAAESMGAGPSVTITSTSSFGATEVTVPAGETLTVINNSSAPHTFTEGENGGEADNARVNEDIAVGATVEVSFPEPGDYNVTCLFHSAMNMVVHVE
ncbi:MAG TPA: plastocyanin/azurin family copper-binding protein [Candidatus Limnocylindria bacterium]|nr:plastocyanin/azurin family copper-binding protein [Candidatus Limnocylindria bacterium]